MFSYSYVTYFIFYAAMFSYSYVYILHSVTAVYKKCSGRYLMSRLVFMCYYFHLRFKIKIKNNLKLREGSRSLHLHLQSPRRNPIGDILIKDT